MTTTDLFRRRRTLALSAATVDAAALGLYLASASLFLAVVIHLPADGIGLVLGLGGAASMVGAVPISRLTERFDAGHVLAGLFIARGCAFVGFAFARDPVSATVVVTVAGFLNRGIGPIIQAVALEGAQKPAQVGILARIRALRNAGIAVGGIPVGFVLAAGSALGFRLMLAAAGASAGVAAVLALRLPPSHAHSKASRGARPPMERGFVLLAVTYGLMTLSGIVMGVGLPLLIVQHAGIPRWTVGGIQVGNTLMVVALQTIFSRGSDRVRRARMMLTAAGAFTACGCLLMLVLSHCADLLAVALVAATVLVFTIAELLASSGGMGLMLTYVPEGQRARYLAVYNLGFAGATIVGPPLVGLALTRQPWSWPCLAGMFLVVSLAAWTLPAGNARTPRLSNVINDPAVTTTEGRTVVMNHGYEVFHPDPSAVADFYVNVLGFTADEENDGSGYLTVRRDDLRVGCSQAVDAPLTPRKPPAGSEIVLRTDDVYAEHDRVKASGWDIEDALQQRPWGLIDFRVFDPTGQYIRITDAEPRD